MIFSKASLEDAEELGSIIQNYFNLSGQKVNYEKSSLVARFIEGIRGV